MFLKTANLTGLLNSLMEELGQMKNKEEKKSNPQRTLAKTYGIIVGLTAIVHGFFETLQGNEQITSSFIEAIGPNQKLWAYGTLHAVTYAPTYLIAGFLAITMGIIVIVWSILFLEKNVGAIIMFLLVIITFLVGGGYGVPMTIGILASIAAVNMNKLKMIISEHSSIKMTNLNLNAWPGSLILFIIVFAASTTLSNKGRPIVDLIGADATNSFVWFMAIIMIILMIVAFCNSIIASSNSLKVAKS